MLSIFRSPHLNSTDVPAHEILAIRCKRHRPYFATDIDFGRWRTLLLNSQHKCNSISLERTLHCGRRGHHSHYHRATMMKVNDKLCPRITLLIDITQGTRSISTTWSQRLFSPTRRPTRIIPPPRYRIMKACIRTTRVRLRAIPLMVQRDDVKVGGWKEVRSV